MSTVLEDLYPHYMQLHPLDEASLTFQAGYPEARARLCQRVGTAAAAPPD